MALLQRETTSFTCNWRKRKIEERATTTKKDLRVRKEIIGLEKKRWKEKKKRKKIPTASMKCRRKLEGGGKKLEKKVRRKNNLATSHPSVKGQTPKYVAPGALDGRDWDHRRPTCFTTEHPFSFGERGNRCTCC